MAAVPSIGRATQIEARRAAGAEATRNLYERFQGQIFGFCMNQLGSREEAEDATQSTFLNAHRALESGVRPDAESAWLFKIAHNVCLTRRRSSFRRRRVEAPSDLQNVQDLLVAPQRDGSDDLIRLTDALAHMPDNQRRAILLREWQGLSYREIADELDLSQPAVETLIFRARRSLAQNLEQQQEEPVERSRLARARKALDLSSIAAALKAMAGGSAAVKAAATAVAVSGMAVGATSPFAPHKTQAAPASVERAHAASAALQPALHLPAPAATLSSQDEKVTRSNRPTGPSARSDRPARQPRPARDEEATPTAELPAATAPATIADPQSSGSEQVSSVPDPERPVTAPKPKETGTGAGQSNAAGAKERKPKAENPGQANANGKKDKAKAAPAPPSAPQEQPNATAGGPSTAPAGGPPAADLSAPGNSGEAPGHSADAPAQSNDKAKKK